MYASLHETHLPYGLIGAWEETRRPTRTKADRGKPFSPHAAPRRPRINKENKKETYTQKRPNENKTKKNKNVFFFYYYSLTFLLQIRPFPTPRHRVSACSIFPVLSPRICYVWVRAFARAPTCGCGSTAFSPSLL